MPTLALPIRPSYRTIGAMNQRRAPTGGQYSREIRLVRRENLLERFGSVIGNEKLRILPTQDHPLILEVRDLLADSANLLDALGLE